ncbi:hypothetical protein TL16_g08531 [Triparma laevis f. inornata]|uniref:DNA mismatch repair protein S5 domain-containing protein n=1 Tax=Triparma laevis f. inornata TaxID=1714386 RepID=A0A9W7EKJ6_9STRA|nr:hypothetical protein TL16_g08531 [Triparma laevis f. inornata]
MFLPQEIVDRIAAGEIVQRPASIVKELLENSLDSGASSIEVTADKGGLASIQITDDGCGMGDDDLPLAAVRFATSKLKTFQDLKSIRTFGFRGEALASASMVSHLSITSRRAEDSIAYKCQYSDGAATPNTLKPSAGVLGTTVKVDDLFYNVPSRKRSFKRDSDEYNRLLDVVQRYAVHRAGGGVGFVCRKKTANSVDLNTKSLPTVKELSLKKKAKADLPPNDQVKAKKEAIGHVFGSALARELVPLECGESDVEAVSVAAIKAINEGTMEEEVGKRAGGERKEREVRRYLGNLRRVEYAYVLLFPPSPPLTRSLWRLARTVHKFTFAYKCKGLITNASYCVKQNSSAFVFFINDRLVQSTGLQKAVEAVYHDLLPTRGRPFVYLSLELPGPHVDVNVHPTKKEVAFLHEDRLCEAVAIAIRSALSSVTSSRSFSVASVVPTAMQEKREKEKKAREVERERQRDSAKRAARELEEKENDDFETAGGGSNKKKKGGGSRQNNDTGLVRQARHE